MGISLQITKVLPVVIKLVTLTAIASFLQLSLTEGAPLQKTCGEWGTGDFTQYWSAYRLGSGGENPYLAERMLELQREIGCTRDKAIMMWLPPWFLLIFEPILSLSFPRAVVAWLVLNTALYFVACMTTWYALFGQAKVITPCILGLLLTFPVWNSFYIGQMGAIEALAGALLLATLRHGRYGLAGPALILFSFKPHNVFLLWILVAWFVLHHRKWQFAVSFFALFILLLILTELRFPLSLSYWLWSFEAEQPLTVSKAVWRTANIGGILSYLLPLPPLTLSTLIAGSTGITLALYLIRTQPIVRFDRWLPVIYLFSLFLGPYTWVFDMTTLLPVHMSLLEPWHRSPRDRRAIIPLAVILSAQTGAFALFKSGYGGYNHHYFWLPLIYAGLLWWKEAQR